MRRSSKPMTVEGVVDSLTSRRPMSHDLAVAALAKLGSVDAGWLVYGTSHSSAEVRIICVEALAQCHSTTAMRLVLHLAQRDSDPNVRVAAVLALGQLRNGLTVETLCRVMCNDEDARVRATAANVAVNSGVPAVASSLQVVLYDEDPSVADAAAEALTHFGDSGIHILRIAASGETAIAPIAKAWLTKSALTPASTSRPL